MNGLQNMDITVTHPAVRSTLFFVGGGLSNFGNESSVSIRNGMHSDSDVGHPSLGFRVVLYVK